ncbi:MAG: hypothetical protein BIFFINMI_02047 [Phycisphaerae bacterium]|nr:hypothetical protein [Phycisphaerae bacterium]
METPPATQGGEREPDPAGGRPDLRPRRSLAPDPDQPLTPEARRARGRIRRLAVLLTLGGICWIGLFGASTVLELLRPAPIHIVITGQQVFDAGSPSSVLVQVLDERTNQPITPARIFFDILDPATGKVLGRGKAYTTDQGPATCTFVPPADAPDRIALRLSVSTSVGNDRVDWPVRLRRPHALSIVTDRPAYRGGQTVRIRLLAQHPVSGQPLGGLQIGFRVLDRRGVVLMQRGSQTTPHGIAVMEYPLGNAAPSGGLLIEGYVDAAGDDPADSARAATAPAEIARTAVYVEPTNRFGQGRDLRLSLESDRTLYRPGQMVRLTLGLTDGQGRPVRGGRARVFTPTNQYELLLDEQGRGEKLILASGSADQGLLRIRAEAGGADQGAVASATLELRVTGEPLVLLATPVTPMQLPGAGQELLVLARDPLGRPVGGVRLIHQGRELARTGPAGTARLVFPKGMLRRLPSVRIDATLGDDAAGQRVELTVPLNWGTPVYHYLLRVARPVLPGEGSSQVTLTGLEAGEQALLELLHDGQAVQTMMVAADAAGQAAVELAVPPGVWGLLRLVSYRMGRPIDGGEPAASSSGRTLDRELVDPQETWLWVARPQRDLTVTLRTDRRNYTPGQSGELYVEVTDPAGKPPGQAVGISLGGLDEATRSAMQQQGLTGQDTGLLAASGRDGGAEELDRLRHWMSPGLWLGRGNSEEQAFWLGVLSGELYSSQWGTRSLTELRRSMRQDDPASRSPDVQPVQRVAPDRRTFHRLDSGPIRREKFQALNRRYQPLLAPGYWFLAALMLTATALTILRNNRRLAPVAAVLLLITLAVSAAGVVALRSARRYAPMPSPGESMLQVRSPATPRPDQPPGAGPELLELPGEPDGAVSRLIDHLLPSAYGSVGPVPGEVGHAFLWRPQLLTGQDGRLTVNFRMPETTSDWWLSADAIDATGRQGRATQDIRSAGQIALDLLNDLPAETESGASDSPTPSTPTLRPGESVRLVACATNSTGYAQRLYVNLAEGIAPGRLELTGETERPLDVAARQSAAAVYDLAALAPGDYALRFTLQTGKDVEPHLAVQREFMLHVRPPRPARSEVFNRFLPAGGQARIDLPPGSGIDSLLLQLDPTRMSAMLRAQRSLADQPGPRIDYWAARISVDHCLLELLDKQPGTPAALTVRLRNDLAAAYASLLDYRASGGGFADHAGDDSSAAATSVALLALGAVQPSNWAIDRRLIDDALLWLRRTQQRRTGSVRKRGDDAPVGDEELAGASQMAWACWACCGAGGDPIQVKGPLESVIATASAAGGENLLLAVLANALYSARRPVEAGSLAVRIADGTRIDGEGMLAVEPGRGRGLGFDEATSRTIATALSAWVLDRTGASSESAAACRRWLMLHRQADGGWGNAVATMVAVRALMAGGADQDAVAAVEPAAAAPTNGSKVSFVELLEEGRPPRVFPIPRGPEAMTVQPEAADLTGLAPGGGPLLLHAVGRGVWAQVVAQTWPGPQHSSAGLSVRLDADRLAVGQAATLELRCTSPPSGDRGWLIELTLPGGVGLDSGPSGRELQVDGGAVRIAGYRRVGSRVELSIEPSADSSGPVGAFALRMPVRGCWAGRYEGPVAWLWAARRPTECRASGGAEVTVFLPSMAAPPPPPPRPRAGPTTAPEH